MAFIFFMWIRVQQVLRSVAVCQSNHLFAAELQPDVAAKVKAVQRAMRSCEAWKTKCRRATDLFGKPNHFTIILCAQTPPAKVVPKTTREALDGSSILRPGRSLNLFGRKFNFICCFIPWFLGRKPTSIKHPESNQNPFNFWSLAGIRK